MQNKNFNDNWALPSMLLHSADTPPHTLDNVQKAYDYTHSSIVDTLERKDQALDGNSQTQNS
jgi:hypothetical protein